MKLLTTSAKVDLSTCYKYTVHEIMFLLKTILVLNLREQWKIGSNKSKERKREQLQSLGGVSVKYG